MIKIANQRAVAWGVTNRKPIQTTTICMISIVDQPSKKRVLCDFGLFICYLCLQKIELMVKNNHVVFRNVPDYLNLMFHAMHDRQRHIHICHGCFFRRLHKKETKIKADQSHVHAPTSKYEGCLLFKEFGFLVDSNTIDVKERTSVDVHGLGQEVGSGAPFHCVIAPEVARRIDSGREISVATPIMECCKPSTCQFRFKGRI